MEAGALTAVGSEESLIPESEFKKLQERARRLERLLGQKTEEIEVLKEAIKLARDKKLISRKPLRGVEASNKCDRSRTQRKSIKPLRTTR